MRSQAVKPVLRDRSRDQRNVVFYDRWSERRWITVKHALLRIWKGSLLTQVVFKARVHLYMTPATRRELMASRSFILIAIQTLYPQSRGSSHSSSRSTLMASYTHSEYTKILEVNLFAFAYRLFRRDFSPLDGTLDGESLRICICFANTRSIL